MAGRVEGKVALLIGGGQTPGETIGNGRATAILLAREGAHVVVVDRDLTSAEDTVTLITDEGGEASVLQADVTKEDEVRGLVEATVQRHGHIDILHNNVGASRGLGDAPVTEITEEVFDAILALNLKSFWLSCKYAIPQMREQRSGSIVNISSMAARHEYPLIGYKTTKTAVIALTENVAAANARYGIRCNSILPGKMNTPMAIEERVNQGRAREEVIASRDRMVPLGGKMGTGWDVAYAALFLHSDEARFITGVSLPVDGGEAMMGGAG
jgi:NAD(P)-dependent dehydrogenase (short-subunit alcohol dehydrogenase family)